jgi:cytochrome d ubiquinol oxidase subunit I
MKEYREQQEEYQRKNFVFKIEIPSALSYMVYLSPDGFIPGIKDLIEGDEERGILSFREKGERGTVAMEALKELKASKGVDETKYLELKSKFEDPEWLGKYFKYFGYGYFKGQKPEVVIPNVSMLFILSI